MIKLRTIILFSIFCVLMSSCATKESIVLFQDDVKKDTQNVTQVTSINYKNYTIKKDDILHVSVSALDMTSIEPFISEYNQARTSDQLLIEGYKVDKETINRSCLDHASEIIKEKLKTI